MVIGVALLGALIFRIRIHAGSYVKDKRLAEAAERTLIQRFNGRQFDAIYDSSADATKRSVSHDQFIVAIQSDFDTSGLIVDDVEAATTCFPEQVRMVRWLKTSKGTEQTAMIIWYLPDESRAQLLMIQVSPGHAPVSSEIVKAHPCSGRVYVTPGSSASGT